MNTRFALLTVMICTLVHPAVRGDNGWSRMNYSSRSCDINGAFLSRVGTVITVGPYGTISGLTELDTLVWRRGSKVDRDLHLGTIAWGDSILVFGDSGMVLVSTDDGHQWNNINVGMQGIVRACLFTEANTLLLCKDDGMFMMMPDNQIRRVSDFHASRIQLLGDGRIVVGGESGGVLLSKDAGESWVNVGEFGKPVTGFTLVHNRLFCATSTAIYNRDTAFTSSWSSLPNPASFLGADIATHSDTLFLASADGPFVDLRMSADGGITWFGGNVGQNGFAAFKMLSFQRGVLLYGERGFYRLAKKGSLYDSTRFAFYGIGRGRDAEILKSWVSITHVKDRVWAAATRSPDNAVWISNDDGETWNMSLNDTTTFNGTEFKDVVSDGLRIVALAKRVQGEWINNKLVMVNTFRLYLSADAGQSWAHVDASAKNQWARNLLLSNNGDLYLYGGNQIYRTDMALTDIDTLSVRLPYAISSMSVNAAGLVVALGRELAVSSDRGETWAYYEVPLATTIDKQVSILNDGSIVMLGLEGSPGAYSVESFRLATVGGSWEAITVLPASPDPRSITAIATDHISFIAACTTTGLVITSTNRGISWSTEKVVDGKVYDLFDIGVNSDGRIYCSGDADYIYFKSYSTSSIGQVDLGGRTGIHVALLANQEVLRLESDSPLDDSRLTILDVSGRCISSLEIPVLGGNIATMPIPLLSSGLYIVRVVGRLSSGVAFIQVTR